MKFCTKCGRERRGSARFCGGCGMPFPEEGEGTAGTAADPAAGEAPAEVAGGDGGDVSAGPDLTPLGAQPEPAWSPPADQWYNPEYSPPQPGYQPPSQPPPGGYPEYSPPQPHFQPPSQPPPGGHKKAIIAAVIAVVVLAAGGGGAAFWLLNRHPSTPVAASQSPSSNTSQSVDGSASPAQTATPTASPTASPAVTPALPSIGIVTASPAVTPSPQATQVMAFLNSYFTAINDHNYQAYLALLDGRLRRGMTLSAFRYGYLSTRDSAATLTAISDPAPGQVAASVTFTSHQLPSHSPSHSQCTHWSITLYLRYSGSLLMIGSAPAGYHASYRAC